MLFTLVTVALKHLYIKSQYPNSIKYLHCSRPSSSMYLFTFHRKFMPISPNNYANTNRRIFLAVAIRWQEIIKAYAGNSHQHAAMECLFLMQSISGLLLKNYIFTILK
jgi:hypothetical protein